MIDSLVEKMRAFLQIYDEVMWEVEVLDMNRRFYKPLLSKLNQDLDGSDDLKELILSLYANVDLIIRMPFRIKLKFVSTSILMPKEVNKITYLFLEVEFAALYYHIRYCINKKESKKKLSREKDLQHHYNYILNEQEIDEFTDQIATAMVKFIDGN
jgi:hypothetical protein